MRHPRWLWIMRASGVLTIFYGVVGYLGWRHVARQGVLRGDDWRVVIACVVVVGLCLIVGSYLRPVGEHGEDAQLHHHPR